MRGSWGGAGPLSYVTSGFANHVWQASALISVSLCAH